MARYELQSWDGHCLVAAVPVPDEEAQAHCRDAGVSLPEPGTSVVISEPDDTCYVAHGSMHYPNRLQRRIEAFSDVCEPDDSEAVLAYESRIADEFGLSIDDMNSEGALFTGEPGKVAHFVYVGLGATIHPRNPDEDWANVTSDGVHIGQIDYNLPRGRVGFSALNTPILPLLQRLFHENPS